MPVVLTRPLSSMVRRRRHLRPPVGCNYHPLPVLRLVLQALALAGDELLGNASEFYDGAVFARWSIGGGKFVIFTDLLGA